MGINLRVPRRILNASRSRSKTLLAAVAILALVTLALRHDVFYMRTSVVDSALSAKHSFLHQHLLQDDPDLVYDFNETDSSPANTSLATDCDYDVARLRYLRETHGLTEKIEYYKRYAKIYRSDRHKRRSLMPLKQKLLVKKPKIVNLRKQGDGRQALACPPPLQIPATRSPIPAAANLSDFMFGVSTTGPRLREFESTFIKEWSHWLTDHRGKSNGGKLVIFLSNATNADISGFQTTLRNSGVDGDVYHSVSSPEMAVRYLALVPSLYKHPERAHKKWLVTCDDDTFFPSPNALVDKFREYDARRPFYIGALSEDATSVSRHGSQAFGGAGVFLSTPMAKVISQKYEKCKADGKLRESDTGWGAQGDILLRKCVYENSDTVLTVIPDLWQVDLRGDLSGFYESGIKPLSLHHYRGGEWHTAHPAEYTKIADHCGEDCTMQRFLTLDDFVISNGFSVAHYPRGIDFDPRQVERTFSPATKDEGWNLDFKLGPQRHSLHRTGRKLAWELVEGVQGDDGSFTQTYIRKAGDPRWTNGRGRPMRPTDGIIELVWIP